MNRALGFVYEFSEDCKFMGGEVPWCLVHAKGHGVYAYR